MTSGFGLILLATAIAGIASYFVGVLVPHQIGLKLYASFAVFWSFMYFVVGTLGGVQQEIARGTKPLDPARNRHGRRALNFALVLAGGVFVLIVGSAPIWATLAFPSQGWGLVWPLAVGATSYVFVATLSGSLYGISRWLPLALMIAVDALLRLLALGVTLVFTHEVVALAWAAAIPFPTTIVVLWAFIRRSIVGLTELDVSYRSLVWNVARTSLAAAAMGVMVSGFPFFLKLTSPGEASATIGLVVLAVTLTRAPLIVVAMSLQSYFIVTFRDNRDTFWSVFLRIQAAVLGGGVVLAALGWLIGPAVFAFLFPGPLQPSGLFIGALVLSSALVASLCVSAPAVLAHSQHFVYSAGWVVGAVATVGALLLPGDFITRVVIALFVGPVLGLLVHGIYLIRTNRRTTVRD
jgi:hypothetical protein